MSAEVKGRRATIRAVPQDPPESALCNHDLEREVLGIILQDQSKLDVVAALIGPDDFDLEGHRIIFSAMLDVRAAGDVPTLLVVVDELASAGHGAMLESIGGAVAVTSLANLVGNPEAAAGIAKRIKRYSLKRQIARALTAGVATAYDVTSDPGEYLQRLRSQLDALEQSTIAAPRYRFLTLDQIDLLSDERYLIDKFLPQDKLGLVYGDSGVGKTFIVLDIVLCICAGIPWHGHTVTSSPVAYIAAEGARGLKKRIRAWRQHHQVDGHLPLYVLPEAVPLMDENRVEELLKAIQELPEIPGLIVIDTLARSMLGGDEQAAKDINQVIAAADKLRQLNQAHVLIIHHSGKDASRGARGSSSLRGAIDTEIVVTQENGLLKVTNSKQRDEATSRPIPLRLRQISFDEHGDVTSAVVVDAEDEGEESHGITPKQQEALNVLLDAPDGLTYGKWLTASGMGNSTLDKARKTLLKEGLIQQQNSGRYFAMFATPLHS